MTRPTLRFSWPLFIAFIAVAFLAHRAFTATKRGELVSHEMGAKRGAPTLVLLHGSGAAGDDFVEIARALIEREGLEGVRIVVLEAPYEYAGGLTWYRSVDERAAAMAKLEAALVSVAEDGVVADRVFVAGFSQGAEMAARLAAQSGPYGGVGLFSGKYDVAFRQGDLSRLGPVFLAHGRRDSVLGFNGAAALHQVLEESDIAVQFEAFDGDHEIPDDIRSAFVVWLKAKLGRELR